jgi:hypothetical protein
MSKASVGSTGIVNLWFQDMQVGGKGGQAVLAGCSTQNAVPGMGARKEGRKASNE